MFGLRATRPLRRTLLRGVQGLAAGVVLSALLVGTGVVVQVWEVAALSVLSLVLACIRLRFLSPVYAGALLMTASFAARAGHPRWGGVWGAVVHHLGGFRTGAWMTVLAGSLLAETALVWWTARHGTSPMVVQSKRGRGIGALWLQLAFVVPVVIPTVGAMWPAPAYASGALHGLWLSGAALFSLLGLPLLAGTSGVFYALPPQQYIRQWAGLNVVCAAVLLAGMAAHRFAGWPSLWWLLWLVVGVREWQRAWTGWQQSRRDPLFAPTEEGVTVLSVLPGSLAETLDLQPGERVMEVNGIAVHSPYDVHFALNQNPAYVRLRVLDRRGEPRLTGHTVYEGERVQLGLVFAPDEVRRDGLARPRFGLLESLYAEQLARRQPYQPTDSTSNASSLNEEVAAASEPREPS